MITQYPFPTTQYIPEDTDKVQIYLHHTAGNSDAFATYLDWTTNPERIATTHVAIRSGLVVQSR